ncbi:MAG: hypothetical protein K6L81_02015 [Agarilytica sp.]
MTKTIEKVETTVTSTRALVAGLIMLGGIGFAIYKYSSGTSGVAAIFIALAFCGIGSMFMPNAKELQATQDILEKPKTEEPS